MSDIEVMSVNPVRSNVSTSSSGGQFSPQHGTSDPTDSFACAICFESWTSDGDHRTVGLKCGHLFGHKCIMQSLALRKKCPTCQSEAYQRDVRLIYVDVSQVSSLKQRLQQKEAEILRQQQVIEQQDEDMNELNIQLDFVTREKEEKVQRLSAELKSLESELRQAEEAIDAKDSEISWKTEQMSKSQSTVSQLQQELEYMRSECHRLENLLENKGQIRVTVCIRWTDREAEVHRYNVQMTDQMGKLEARIAEKVAIPVTRLELRFKGRRVREKESADQIGLRDEDVIHVYVRR